MPKTLPWTAIACISLLLAAALPAQYGTAPSGYYPPNYSGSTFAGTLTAANEDQITMTFNGAGKTQTFTGRFESTCSYPDDITKKMRPMKATDIPIGSGLTAFYETKSTKVNGQKMKVNWIVEINIDRWGQRKIDDDRQGVIVCTKAGATMFRAF